jgi:radical SAM superfamily enzyme YgiQ (UPF0313 family)
MSARPRILLLQPAVGEWDGMRSSPALPLSLLHAASVAVRDWDVRIFDRRIHGADWQERLRAELDPAPLLVGVTAFTGPMIRSALDMCDVVRAARPEVPIAWGGVHPSLLPAETTLQDPRADFVVQGEGEYTLPALARAVAEGKAPVGIPGVWWKDADGVHGSPPELIENLDELPTPPWHLVDVARYQPTYKGRRSIYLQSSRGCPFRCGYCYNGVFNGRRWRGCRPNGRWSRSGTWWRRTGSGTSISWTTCSSPTRRGPWPSPRESSPWGSPGRSRGSTSWG